MYFTTKLTQYLANTTLIFVINHSSLKLGKNRYDFMQLLIHVSDFVLNIPKFKNSTLLVATNVVNTYKKGKLVDDEAVIGSINFFLRKFREDLFESRVMAGENFKSKIKIDRYIEIVDIFLLPGKVTLSRSPDEEGKIIDDELIQNGKRNIYEAIKKTDYSSVSEIDFGYTISEESKIDIHYLLDAINVKVETKIFEAFRFWQKNREFVVESNKNWTEISNKLNLDFNVLKEFKNKLNLSTSTSEVTVFLRDAGFSVGINIPNLLISTAIRYDGYMNFFRLVGNIEEEFNSFRFFSGLDNLVYFISRNKLWYGFLLSLRDHLESYEVQVNKEKFQTIYFNRASRNFEKSALVRADNFNEFFDKAAEKSIALRESWLVTEVPLSQQQVHEVNKVILETLDDDTTYSCDKPDNMVIKGRIIVLRNFSVNSPCNYQNGKTESPSFISVFAASTVFIDEEITVEGEKTLFIISPKVVALGKVGITMKGRDSLHMYKDLRVLGKINREDCKHELAEWLSLQGVIKPVKESEELRNL